MGNARLNYDVGGMRGKQMLDPFRVAAIKHYSNMCFSRDDEH